MSSDGAQETVLVHVSLALHLPSRGPYDVSPMLTSQPISGSHLRHLLCSSSLAAMLAIACKAVPSCPC